MPVVLPNRIGTRGCSGCPYLRGFPFSPCWILFESRKGRHDVAPGERRQSLKPAQARSSPGIWRKNKRSNSTAGATGMHAPNKSYRSYRDDGLIAIINPNPWTHVDSRPWLHPVATSWLSCWLPLTNCRPATRVPNRIGWASPCEGFLTTNLH